MPEAVMTAQPIKTIADPPEIKTVSSRRVYCDGDEGVLGHPRIYLDMGSADSVDCPYCGRRFVYGEAAP